MRILRCKGGPCSVGAGEGHEAKHALLLIRDPDVLNLPKAAAWKKEKKETVQQGCKTVLGRSVLDVFISVSLSQGSEILPWTGNFAGMVNGDEQVWSGHKFCICGLESGC